MKKSNTTSISLAEKPFNSKLRGKWNGRNHDKMIFVYLYIMKKYNDIAHIDFSYTLRLYTVYKPVKIDCLFKITSWKEQKKYDINKRSLKSVNSNLYEYFNRVRNVKKKFTVFIASINSIINNIEEDGHSIAFIYDKDSNEVELFDSINTSYLRHKKNINLFFTNIYGKDVKIIYPNLCINFGKMIYNNCNDINYKYNSRGFCIIWSLWYIELRLKNPKKTKEEVMLKAFKELKTKDKVCRFIRGYSQFVDNIVKDYQLELIDGKVVAMLKNKKTHIPHKLISIMGLNAAIVAAMAILYSRFLK